MQNSCKFEEKLCFPATMVYEKSQLKLSKKEPVCTFKESWCVGLGQEGGCLPEGGENCLKYFKREWNREEGRANKNAKHR